MRWIIITCFLFLFSCQSQDVKDSYFFPAEWDAQESIWLGWSEDSSIQEVHLQMAKALAGNVGLTILSRSDSLRQVALKQLKEHGIDTSKVTSYIHSIPNVFIRDVGPRFLLGQQKKLAIADFAWSNYGYPSSFQNYQYSNERGKLDNDLAALNNWSIISSSSVSEGGAIDVSTDMMMCFKETALQRNPGMSLVDIEKEYLRVYGKKKMLWLNQMPLMDKVVEGPKIANYFGYGANGHIDEFVRFANDSTILVGMIKAEEKDMNPVNQVDYEIMNDNLQVLYKATTTQGKPFRIIILPVPSYSLYTQKEALNQVSIKQGDGPVLFKNFKVGDTIQWLPAVSYLNFLISNNKVLVPTYWVKGLPESERAKDETVKRIFETVFPNQTVVQINPLGLNRNGGGMHCASQQEPKR